MKQMKILSVLAMSVMVTIIVGTYNIKSEKGNVVDKEITMVYGRH